MAENTRGGRAVVLDDSGRLRGIITRTDLLRQVGHRDITQKMSESCQIALPSLLPDQHPLKGSIGLYGTVLDGGVFDCLREAEVLLFVRFPKSPFNNPCPSIDMYHDSCLLWSIVIILHHLPAVPLLPPAKRSRADIVASGVDGASRRARRCHIRSFRH